MPLCTIFKRPINFIKSVRFWPKAGIFNAVVSTNAITIRIAFKQLLQYVSGTWGKRGIGSSWRLLGSLGGQSRP